MSTLRERLRHQLADLKMPGSLEALDSVLARIDGGQIAAGEAIGQVLEAQISLRNNRRLEAAMRSSRLPAVRTLADFDFSFQPSIKREQIESLHTLGFIERKENVVFLGPPGTGTSHLAQAIGQAAINQGHRVLYREAHLLLEELTDATLDGTRKEVLAMLSTVPLLIIDDLGMRKLPPTAAEDLLELIMRRYERASTLLTSNRPVDDWGKLLGDTAAVTALLDRLLHHAHVLTCGPRSWRTKLHTATDSSAAAPR